MHSKSAVVLLSGGQDSTTCFYYALQFYGKVAAVSFDYGQRHRVELDLAAETAAKNDVDHQILPVEALRVLGAASLTNPDIRNDREGDERNTYADEHGLPPSFVPGRNLLFFTLAAASGLPRGYDDIVTGVCQQDDSGYPDCREKFVAAMEKSIRIGMDAENFRINAPLLHLSKAQTWEMAEELGIMAEIVIGTQTCYEGAVARETPPKPWGYGCGECGACVEREKGYDEWQATRKRQPDPRAVA
jgi:7-cyano-7-deazaguanine synthase